MSASKIYSPNRLYSFLLRFVGYFFSSAYKKVQYVDVEKIPTDGAVIYAPNHTSALMDALTILFIDEKPKAFVARADIFKIKFIAKILTFLKIIPIMRIRDGYSELKKNDKTIRDSIDILEHGVPLNVFPEGTHSGKHSLLPLLKGIFRIAIKTQVEIKDDMPVYIVPVSITYGNFFKYKSTLRAQVLDPINIREFIRDYDDPFSPKLINDLKELLYDRMKNGVLYIEDNELYDAKYDLCAIMGSGNHKPVTNQFEDIKETLKIVETLPQDILKSAKEFSEIRIKEKISIKSILTGGGKAYLCPKILLLIVAFPYAILANIANSPISGLTSFLINKMKDPVFNNSVRYVLTLILWPILVIIYSAILFANLHWALALVLSIILIIPANNLALKYNKLLRLTISDIKFLSNKKLRARVSAIKENIKNVN